LATKRLTQEPTSNKTHHEEQQKPQIFVNVTLKHSTLASNSNILESHFQHFQNITPPPSRDRASLVSLTQTVPRRFTTKRERRHH